MTSPTPVGWSPGFLSKGISLLAKNASRNNFFATLVRAIHMLVELWPKLFDVSILLQLSASIPEGPDFSVWFCNNSLLVLKMRFQVFSFASKKVQGFSSDRKILMLLLSVVFHLQNRASVFWNFNFQPRYLGKRSLCPGNQAHFLKNSDKSLLSPEQNKSKKIWDTFL